MRLGINIDHVATLRNARGGVHPEPMRTAEIVKAAGADLITIHLREDRRHIRDADAVTLIESRILPINLEMAATEEMVAFALKHKPYAVCIVPEKREELTTEGGLDVASQVNKLRTICDELKAVGIRTSLFIDPEAVQVEASLVAGAECVEIHTGGYAEAFPNADKELLRIQQAVQQAHNNGLEVHAGHGLDYDNVVDIAKIPHIQELNIGHFLVGEALFVGFEEAIGKMRDIIKEHAV